MDNVDAAAPDGVAFFSAHPPPPMVSLTPFSPPSPSPSLLRRLSRRFSAPTPPVPSRKQLAWISLQGRLVGAEEATSARTIAGRGLSPELAVAWELFTPIHRVLIVSVAAVAASHSKKNMQISLLQKSVHIRDQVLSNMQQKLDDLCEQLNNMKDQSKTGANMPLTKSAEDSCWLCDQHWSLSNDFGVNSAAKASSGDDIFKYKTLPTAAAEQEERRMSDLSDWASSSITSSAETQTNTSAAEHYIFTLKKESEEKDATIKMLSTFLQSSNIDGSKRIGELEDIIRRKNQIITKLKKDMVVLEQKVIHQTRLRRPSFSASSSSTRQLPFMADNVIYDMDSTTSPSSSDSDCSRKSLLQKTAAKIQEIPVQDSELSSGRSQKSTPQTPAAKVEETQAWNSELGKERSQKSTSQTPAAKIEETQSWTSELSTKSNQKSIPAKASNLVGSTDRHKASHSASPLQEKSMNQRAESVSSLKPRKLSVSGGVKTRQRAPAKSKDSAPHKKWT